jgi:hypothetical protein
MRQKANALFVYRRCSISIWSLNPMVVPRRWPWFSYGLPRLSPMKLMTTNRTMVNSQPSRAFPLSHLGKGTVFERTLFMELPVTLAALERDTLAALWAAQRPHQLGLDLCWSSQNIIQKQDMLALLQQYPDIAQRPLMTLIGRAETLQDYMRQELEEYLAYRLEKILQAQFRLLFPDKRGRWDQLPATGWQTLVVAVRAYQAQLAQADPAFSPPQPGDEGYFAFVYRVSCASEPDGIVQKSGCTGRELRQWREEGKLPEVADEQSLLPVLAPLLTNWLPPSFLREPLIYHPFTEEDGAILASLLSFLQTGAPLAAFPASDGEEEKWEERKPTDYTVHVRIQASDGGGFCEHCDDEAWIRISREELLAWGREQAEAMPYYRDNGILDVWLEDQLVRQLGDPALQDHSHTFFFAHRAQAVLDEMVELLSETFLPTNPAS